MDGSTWAKKCPGPLLLSWTTHISQNMLKSKAAKPSLTLVLERFEALLLHPLPGGTESRGGCPNEDPLLTINLQGCGIVQTPSLGLTHEKGCARDGCGRCHLLPSTSTPALDERRTNIWDPAPRSTQVRSPKPSGEQAERAPLHCKAFI